MRYKQLFLTSAGLLLCSIIQAQDFFEDLSGSGNPISLNLAKTFNISARLNVGDNSAKANIFKMFHAVYKKGTKAGNRIAWQKEKGFPEASAGNLNAENTPEDFSYSVGAVVPKSSFKLLDFGLGGSIKGKIKEGIGNLFSKGSFTGESQFSFYGVLHRVTVVEDKHKHTYVISPFINLVYADLRLLPDTTQSFKKVDSNVNRINFGISGFRKSYIKGKSQIILGGSVTWSRQNNYDDLNKGELKEFVTRFDSFGRTLTTVEDKGYIYGLGDFKEYRNTNLRVYATYIPYSLEYRAAIVVYPSIDVNNLYKKSLFNLGLGFHFLEKDNPSLSTLGLIFEFNDMYNAKEKADPFIKRSFRIGLTAALNVTSLIKKEK